MTVSRCTACDQRYLPVPLEVTDEMVERGARAAFEDRHPGFDWDRAPQHERWTWLGNVEAALTAALRQSQSCEETP